MNKKQLIVAGVMCVGIYMSIITAIQLNNFYSHSYRAKDKKGNITHFIPIGRKDTWNDVLKKPLISAFSILGICGLIIYALRDKKK